MSLSTFFIVNTNGKILIFRDYRGDVPFEVVEDFIPTLQKQEEDNVTPIILEKNISFAYVKIENLYFTSAIRKNANITLVFAFMYKFIEIAFQYFSRLEEESIKDNYVILYELLDEVMDFGYPQTTDPKILQTYIFQESYKLKKLKYIPSVVTNVVSWRPEGLLYKNNELFVDVIESIYLSINNKNSILKSEVYGCVKLKVHLSGMPQLRLGLSDKVLDSPDSQTFEDVKFHQCVQLSRIIDKNIYFIPPDGDFELMSYRINMNIKPLIFVNTEVLKKSTSVKYRIIASAKFRKNLTARNVEIIVPLCSDIDSPTIKASTGHAFYSPENSTIIWKIKYLPGEFEGYLIGRFKICSITGDEKPEKTPVQIKFMMPYFTVSGLQIKFIKVIEKSNYKALTWVRYTTQNEDYHISFS